MNHLKKILLLFILLFSIYNNAFAWLAKNNYSKVINLTWWSYEITPQENYNIIINKTTNYSSWILNIYDSWSLVWFSWYDDKIMIHDKLIMSWSWIVLIDFSVVYETEDINSSSDQIFDQEFLDEFFLIQWVFTIFLLLLIWIFKILYLAKK